MASEFASHAAGCAWCFGRSYCSTGEELLAQEQGSTDDCWAERSADRVVAGISTGAK